MFLTNAEFLALLGQFAEAGFIIAVFWDIVRFIRIVMNGGKISVFISDFFLTVITLLVIMFLSIEWGGGRIRLLFFVSSVFGMVIYFYTIGVITKAIAGIINKLFLRLRKCIGRYIYKPVERFFELIKQKSLNIFAQIRQKMLKYVKKSDLGLKKHTSMLYNNKIGKLCANGGEERNVIKAKIRKKA